METSEAKPCRRWCQAVTINRLIVIVTVAGSTLTWQISKALGIPRFPQCKESAIPRTGPRLNERGKNELDVTF